LKRFSLTDIVVPIQAELKNKPLFWRIQVKEDGKFEDQDLSEGLCKNNSNYTQETQEIKIRTQGIKKSKRWAGSGDLAVVDANILIGTSKEDQ